jgi:hypothetical protein
MRLGTGDVERAETDQKKRLDKWMGEGCALGSRV